MIDPQPSADAEKMLLDAGIRRILILLTHEHFDHVCGIPFWRARFSVTVVAHTECAKSLATAKNQRPLALLTMITPANRDDILCFYRSLPVQSIPVDCSWAGRKHISWQGHDIRLKETSGHSLGSCLIFIDDDMIFTGDSVVPDRPVILRYPNASRTTFLAVTLPKLLALPKTIRVFPGHGAPCRMADLQYRDEGFFRRSTVQ